MFNKFLFLTLLCALSMSLSACGSNEEPVAPTEIPPTAISEPTPMPPTAEPEAAESEAAESEVTESEVAEPEAVEPEAAESEVTESEAVEPEVAEPEVAEPEAAESEVAEPEVAEPEVAESEAAESEVAESDEEETVSEIITETVPSIEEVIAESVVGELTFPSLGNDHIPFGSRTPIEYNTTPPSSGPHYSNIIEWGIYDRAIPYELLVHNLEDGGVVVYYQCEEPCPELVQQLSDAITPYLEYDWHVVMAPNEPYELSEGSEFGHLDMDAKIAVIAWQKVLKLDEFDSDAILLFLEKYEGIDHHKRG